MGLRIRNKTPASHRHDPKGEKNKQETQIKTECVQFSSVTQLCPTLCDPMDYSTSGLRVHHQLPGFTQTHVH